jgi:hypothetical protein
MTIVPEAYRPRSLARRRLTAEEVGQLERQLPAVLQQDHLHRMVAATEHQHTFLRALADQVAP